MVTIAAILKHFGNISRYRYTRPGAGGWEGVSGRFGPLNCCTLRVRIRRGDLPPPAAGRRPRQEAPLQCNLRTFVRVMLHVSGLAGKSTYERTPATKREGSQRCQRRVGPANVGMRERVCQAGPGLDGGGLVGEIGPVLDGGTGTPRRPWQEALPPSNLHTYVMRCVPPAWLGRARVNPSRPKEGSQPRPRSVGSEETGP